MIVEIRERVLTYLPSQLAQWIDGDKSLTPAFSEVPPILKNQPKYHFAEMLALRNYHEAEGWVGFAHYAIGPQYPQSQRRLVSCLVSLCDMTTSAPTGISTTAT